MQEICQIVLAVLINGDTLSLINVCGLLFCISGIICHVLHKYREHILENRGNIDGVVKFEKSWMPNQMIGGRPGQQHIPLLDAEDLGNSDSDESQNDQKNSSEVIFDVLKSRDK